jgi:hypothetical protein
MRLDDEMQNLHSVCRSTMETMMNVSHLDWKADWPETRQRFVNWWQQRGCLIAGWCTNPKNDANHEPVEAVTCNSRAARLTDPALRARTNHYELSIRRFWGDLIPVSDTNVGPGSLALLAGVEPGFAESTVWFDPCWHELEEPESLPPIRFDPANRWWQIHEETARQSAALGAGKYLVGMPDLEENIDILCALRSPQVVMMDLIERPEWVKQKIDEINELFFNAFTRLYDIIKLPDGSMCSGSFLLWGPGRTAKVQCDASVMLSPAMFREFVIPPLRRQCDWLDNAMYHLDGTQAIHHLDALLEIKSLDAIEWTPQAGIEEGGHPRWYPLYRRILAAGKSVQAVCVKAHEVLPLLEATGPDGMYILAEFENEAESENIIHEVNNRFSR